MSTSHEDDSYEVDADLTPTSQRTSDQHTNDQHFDELDAVRRFPSEDVWLNLPMPSPMPGQMPGPISDPARAEVGDVTAAPMDTRPFADRASFADRVLLARQAERQLDADLDDLEGAFPAELLAQFAAPTPSDTFVERTVANVMHERRQRWQEMLARHVAPEPSTVFVSRTLAALRNEVEGQSGSGSRNQKSEPQQKALGHALPDAAAARGSSNAGSNSAGRNSAGRNSIRNWPVFGLVAAAAAALLWLSWTGDVRPPLELRLANQASPAVAYSDSTTPMSAILAHIAHDEEPSALFDEPADGLWLTNSHLPDAGGLR